MLFEKIHIFLIGYLCGSISGAYIIGRLLRRNVIEEFGDGHIGTSFAIKYLGTVPGFFVALIDFFKGFLPVFISLKNNFNPYLILIFSLGIITGHNWSIFLKFQGGLGAACMYGILFALFPFFLVISLLIGLFFFFSTKDTFKSTLFIILILSALLLINRIPLPFLLIPPSLFSIMSYKVSKIKKRINI